MVDRQYPEVLPPLVHAVYWPTFDLKVGDEITFKVRSFYYGTKPAGGERWDFGDGMPQVEVRFVPMERGAAKPHAKDGYAITTHRYAKPGDYLVSASLCSERMSL